MYTVVAQRRIDVPLERTWEFLAVPRLLGRWFADPDRLAPGEPFRFDFGDGDFHSGKVVEWEPGIVLGLRWTVLGLGPEYEVRFTLLPRRGGTELSVQDRGALTLEEAECLRVGWHEFLMRLESAAVRGVRARFNWRKLINLTGRLTGNRSTLMECIHSAEWYERRFEGVRATVRAGEKPDSITARLESDAWNGAATELQLQLRRIRGNDYVVLFHEGWGSLPPRVAPEERRRYVGLWTDALTTCGVS